jgi:hypothetical protein
MPNKTRMLDYGGFVRSSETADATFDEYLRLADRLHDRRQRAFEEWNQSPFTIELLEQKKAAEADLEKFKTAFAGTYTIKSVERDPRFLSLSRFFAQNRPIAEDFSILHCTMDVPLHTVHSFQGKEELDQLNAALDEKTPLRWWQNGPLNQPCYLFGPVVWELKPAEISQSEKGIVLLFEQTIENQQRGLQRLRQDSRGALTGNAGEFIPETVRVFVWRRDGGKCVKCGSRQALEFQRLVPNARGNAPDCFRLLCGRCAQKA